MRILTACENFT